MGEVIQSRVGPAPGEAAYAAGQVWRTRGGWEAVIVWVATQPLPGSLLWQHHPAFAVHCAGTDRESIPWLHTRTGHAARARNPFGESGPPCYDGHPADLVELIRGPGAPGEGSPVGADRREG